MNSIATDEERGHFIKKKRPEALRPGGAVGISAVVAAGEGSGDGLAREHVRTVVLAGERPLVVDLDGTLLKSDLLLESIFSLLSARPLRALGAIAALRNGKAAFKARIAADSAVKVEMLPLNKDLLALLRLERAKGRKIYLASGSDRRYVEPLALHLGLFDGVLASDGKTNLSGQAKAAALCKAFGEGGFDYAGNARADLEVWKKAKGVLVVNAGRSLRHAVGRRFPAAQYVGRRALRLADCVRALRVHQWLKNLLILVPALAAHQFTPATLLPLLLAFLSFSLFASGTYLINDLLDLSNDRQHRTKRNRPFASGAIPLWLGPLMVVLLLAAACVLARYLPAQFIALLLGYGVLTVSYSMWLKRKMMVDVLTLACLYGMRLVAGGVAVSVQLSPWLVAFSMFLFLSLAIVKRCTELIARFEAGKGDPSGRGYQLRDLPVLEAMAAASGYVASMVFAFYINSPAVMVLYHAPERLWLICVVLIYWISRMVVLTHRGRMHDDPIVFAATDRVSLISAAAIAAAVVAASV